MPVKKDPPAWRDASESANVPPPRGGERRPSFRAPEPAPTRYSPADLERHAEMLANRVGKAFRRFHPAFERRGIGAFRLYDWDIPEVRAVVDWYEGHVVLAEYERTQTEGTGWLEVMGKAVAQALNIPAGHVHLKRRRTRPGGREPGGARAPRYEKMGERGTKLTVREGDLRFLVNLDDFIDTGLFPDHRITRALLRKESEGAEMLNLYAYTGAFTVAAASGGAKSTTTVDASSRYLAWCRENLALNGFTGGEHHQERADVRAFLRKAAGGFGRFDLCVLDPPSFSTRAEGLEGSSDLDLQRDHPALIREALAVLREGGVLWFSTNHQRFEPRLDEVRASEIVDMTERTVPEDYRNRQVHRCWRIVK